MVSNVTVSNVTVDINTISVNGGIITLTLSWREPFNSLDPIVNYTVSCSGNVTCPPNFEFITTDNTTTATLLGKNIDMYLECIHTSCCMIIL